MENSSKKPTAPAQGQPLVSVILPIFNGARYVEKSIESILHQSYKNWELIIHDAASTDNTLEVLDDIWEAHPILKEKGRIICEKEKVNVPKALNIGFRAAKGDFFTWTSDDNIYLPTAFQRMVESLQRNPEYSLTYAHSFTIDQDGHRTGELRSKSVEHLVDGNNIGLCFMFKREVFEQINGYDENRFLVEDYDFWMRASEFFKFYHLDEFLYEIRYHTESLTDNRGDKISLLAEDVFERDLSSMNRWLPLEWQIRGHLRLIRTGITQKKWGRVLRQCSQALKKSPTLTITESAAKLGRGINRTLGQ